jgi:deoxyribonuclease-4
VAGIVADMLFGAHVSSSGGIDKAIDRIEAIGGDAVQVFTQSPRMWRPTTHAPEAIERFKQRRAEAGIGAVACHALYLINLAAPKFFDKSIEALRATVDTACAIEADGVIFHVGSHLGDGFEAGLEHVVPALLECVEHCNDRTWLLMENTAGAGGTIGRSIEELAAIFERLERHPRLGICLDSCHLYASGFDVTDRNELDRVVEQVDELVGLDRLRALHVNDSAAPLGSNRDRHANMLEGLMGEQLGVFLAHPALQHLPVYLETPGADKKGPDANEVRKLRELHQRWTAKRRRPSVGSRKRK